MSTAAQPSSSSTSHHARWDIFCRVIDNFGDIGVCWRLARQLAAEHDLQVRLWIDDLSGLPGLCPEIVADLDQQWAVGVEIRRWIESFPDVEPADIVIEAFACELPDSYLQAMAAAKKPPGWINLEYLSAEPWVESCHGVASPHPTLPLIKHFFFPGFSPKTGGLLCETNLLAQRDAHAATRQTSAALQISLFCYDTAPVGALLDAWAASERPIHCRVSAGKASAAVEAYFGKAGPWQLGKLTVEPISFVPQPDYDALLWQSDLNLVRGEDSFVRAQWAAKSFVWNIYPQEDGAHVDKLDAFLGCYSNQLPAEAVQAVTDFFHAWNGTQPKDLAAAWRAYEAQLPALAAHGKRWSQELAGLGNLAENLVKFCTYRI